MVDIINLSCPTCGGRLQITQDIERFACGYCGNELMVRRTGGIVSLAPIVDMLKDVKQGVDKSASELAIVRLEKEIFEINKTIDNINPTNLNSPVSWYKPTIQSIGIIAIGFVLMVVVIEGLSLRSLLGGIVSSILMFAPIFFIFRSIYLKKLEKYNKWNAYENSLLTKLETKTTELEKHQMVVSR